MFTRTTRRTSIAGAAAVLALGLTLTGCSAGATTTTGGAGSSSSAAASPTTPGLNTPVKAGPFEFTALAAKAAGTTVGTAPLSQTAQGTYFQVQLKVQNTGDSAETFIVNYVKLVDSAGKTYDADGTASIYAGDSKTWIAAINPGNAVQGPVFFDVPVGTKPVSIKVSSDMFSDGETIRLS